MSQPPTRLICLVPKPLGHAPGQRFRLEQWAPVLAARHGIELDFATFESTALTRILYRRGYFASKAVLSTLDFGRRAAALLRARSYAGAIVHREAALLGPAVYERLLGLFDVPFVFDFDDAVWLPQPGRNGVFARLHFHGKTSTICRLASVVTCGNEYLAEYARARNRETHVVPTTVDVREYANVAAASPGRELVVVWSGSLHTLAHFERARSALERFARQHPLAVRVVCNERPSAPIAHARNEFVAWSPEVEVKALAGAHVGIMPLPDDEFCRGKCGLKALQYMAAGRPAIVSPVGMNRALVRDGHNGWLAATDDEWCAALRAARDPALRAALGARARRTVEDGYSRETGAAAFARAVRVAVA